MWSNLAAPPSNAYSCARRGKTFEAHGDTTPWEAFQVGVCDWGAKVETRTGRRCWQRQILGRWMEDTGEEIRKHSLRNEYEFDKKRSICNADERGCHREGEDRSSSTVRGRKAKYGEGEGMDAASVDRAGCHGAKAGGSAATLRRRQETTSSPKVEPAQAAQAAQRKQRRQRRQRRQHRQRERASGEV